MNWYDAFLFAIVLIVDNVPQTSANVQCVFITELLTPYLRSLPPIDSPPFVIHLKPWNEEESAAILVEEYINVRIMTR